MSFSHVKDAKKDYACIKNSVYAESDGTHSCEDCFETEYEGIVEINHPPWKPRANSIADALNGVLKNPSWPILKKKRPPWHPPYIIKDYDKYIKKRKIKNQPDDQ